MMRLISRNKLLLLLVLSLLAVAFIYVVLRSGPLASVPVTVFEVQEMPVEPSLFGIGTVEARYTQNIGPTGSGRVLELLVDVGDRVETGQVIGIDMTDEQLEVANRHVDSQMKKFGYTQSNVQFVKGYIEDLESAGIANESVDLVVSNCVINLSPEKERVFREIFRVLKPGGEIGRAHV